MTDTLNPVYNESEGLGMVFRLALEREAKAMRQLRECVSNAVPYPDDLATLTGEVIAAQVAAQPVRSALQHAPNVTRRIDKLEEKYQEIIRENGVYQVVWASALARLLQELLSIDGSRSTNDWRNLSDDTRAKAIARLLKYYPVDFDRHMAMAIPDNVLYAAAGAVV